MRKSYLDSGNSGFTLTELLIAAGLTSLVITLSGSGLVMLMNARQAAEEQQFRRTELERAMDYIANDIRSARRVNVNPATNQTGTAHEAMAAVTHQPLREAIAGTEVLVLAIPVGVCPSKGPVIDDVIYEVRGIDDFDLRNVNTNRRTSLQRLWRGPYVIYRHGRIPGLNGLANPCSQPVVTEILVDGILNDLKSLPPTCGEGATIPGKAIRSGLGGFHACVQSGQVALMLRAEVQSNSGKPTQITVYGEAFQRAVASAAPTSAATCPPARVPNVLGKENSIAKGMITRVGLTHNGIADAGLNTPSRVVNFQAPPPGTTLPCGQIVTFTFKP